MNNDIHSLILKLLARECDLNPHKSLEEIWNSCQRKLTEIGVPDEYIKNVVFEKEIKPFFEHRNLPNPLYWKKLFNQHIVFYLIRSNSKRYLSLLKVLKEKIPDITYFVCYGEIDVIIRFMGDLIMIEQMEEILSILVLILLQFM